MYSTLIDDEEYNPLLILYLTTTGNTLQNHTRSQLVKQVLRQVIITTGDTRPPINLLRLAAAAAAAKP